MDIPPISQPTPLSVNVPVPPTDSTQQQQSGGDTLLDRPKKKRRKQVPKLTALDLTQSSAISSLVNIGRATSEEYTKSCERAKQKAKAKAKAKGTDAAVVADIGIDVQARMLETVLRRAARWAAGIAPQHSLAQFVMEARALSAKRDVRSYISNVRLAQLRGADIDDGNGGVPVDGQEDGDTTANANEDGNATGVVRTSEMSVRAMLANDAGDVNGGGRHDAGVAANMADMMMDDIPDMDDVMPQASGSKGMGGGPPAPEDDGWDEPEDMLMDDMPMDVMPMPIPTPMPKPMPANVSPPETAAAGEQDKGGKVDEATSGANTEPGPGSETGEAAAQKENGAAAATAGAAADKDGVGLEPGHEGVGAKTAGPTGSADVLVTKTTGDTEGREAHKVSKATEGG